LFLSLPEGALKSVWLVLLHFSRTITKVADLGLKFLKLQRERWRSDCSCSGPGDVLSRSNMAFRRIKTSQNYEVVQCNIVRDPRTRKRSKDCFEHCRTSNPFDLSARPSIWRMDWASASLIELESATTKRFISGQSPTHGRLTEAFDIVANAQLGDNSKILRFLWLPFPQHQYLQPAQQIAPYQRAQYLPAPQYVPQIQPAQGGQIRGPTPIIYHQYGNRQSQSARPVVTGHSSSNLHKDFNGCRHLNLALSFVAEYNYSLASYQTDCCIEHDGWNVLGDQPESVLGRLREAC